MEPAPGLARARPVGSIREHDADGHCHFGGMLGGREFTGLGIHAENGEAIRLLIGRDEPFAIWREIEIARVAALSRGVVDGREFASRVIKAEERDAIVAAI